MWSLPAVKQNPTGCSGGGGIISKSDTETVSGDHDAFLLTVHSTCNEPDSCWREENPNLATKHSL